MSEQTNALPRHLRPREPLVPEHSGNSVGQMASFTAPADRERVKLIPIEPPGKK